MVNGWIAVGMENPVIEGEKPAARATVFQHHSFRTKPIEIHQGMSCLEAGAGANPRRLDGHSRGCGLGGRSRAAA
jgi:hypothetical protein